MVSASKRHNGIEHNSCLHLVQSNSGIFLEFWELLSGKGLGIEKPLLGSQEAPQQNPRESDLKKMCYSTWKFDTHIAHLKYSYLGFLLELEAPHGVQNDRNSHIMVGEWWFEGAQTFIYRYIQVFSKSA